MTTLCNSTTNRSEEMMIMTTPTADQPGLARRLPTRLTIAAAGLLVAVVLSGCGDDDRGDTADPDPAGVIENYRVAYNDGDIEGVMTVFSEESVLTGHPYAPETAGLAAMRSLQVEDMEVAASTDAYEFSNVEASGDTVTWDHVWTNGQGTDWCAEGNTAVTANGQILTWTFAPYPHPCP